MALARPPPLEELSKELLSVDEEGCAEDEDEAAEDPTEAALEAAEVVEFVFFADWSNFSFSSINFIRSFSSRNDSTRNRSCREKKQKFSLIHKMAKRWRTVSKTEFCLHC